MLRSFQELGRVSAGFESSHILTLRISGNWGETGNMNKLTQRINRSLVEIRAIPGVAAAATTASLPGIPSDNRTEVKLIEAANSRNERIFAESRFVSAGYFSTLQIPVLGGKACRDSDSYNSVLVNKSFANTYLSKLYPIGRHVSFAAAPFNSGPAAVIFGVVLMLANKVLIAHQFHGLLVRQRPFPKSLFSDPNANRSMEMANSLRQRIHSFEPARSVFGISPLEEHLIR